MSETVVFKPIYLPCNKGLGNALKEAINNSSNNLIARMDSDDISFPYRFQKQLEVFIRNPMIDVVGGPITEFVGDPTNIMGERKVELDDRLIKYDMKKRCAMNHVSVMYKKDAVQSSGGYQDWYYNEDYYLWIRMIENGCKFANVPYPLVNVRTGEDMSARRGGWTYFRSEQRLQKYMLNHHFINFPRYIYNVGLRFMGEVIVSNSIRQQIFKMMREKCDFELASKAIKSMAGEALKVTDYPTFTVAISVYKNDNPKWFDIALESIINQTVKPSEIVLVVDGVVKDDIHQVIEKYSEICKCGNLN